MEERRSPSWARNLLAMTPPGRALVAWAQRNWLALAHVLVCAAVILPIAARPGWPYNHEVSGPFQRVEAFRREFAAGNLFPLWTPFCFNGHGSPMPFLYHRLFNSVAGLLALPFGTVGGVKRALVLSLIVGSLGISAAARELGSRPAIRLWCGAILPVAHYTLVNWLVRGSPAELSAGMLVAWLIYVCLRMQSGKPFGARLGVVLVLIFYAHLVVFLYTLPLLVVAVVTHVATRPGARAQATKRVARGVGIAAAIVVVFAAPYAAAIGLIGREFNLDRLAIYVPQHELVAVSRYFADGFPWGQQWRGFSVEIGRFLLVATFLAGAIVLGKRPQISVPPLAFMVVSAAAYFWFQLPVAARFFVAVPIAQIIQFPWRLLVFITPLVILILAALAGAVWQLGGRWVPVAIVLLAGPWCAQARLAWMAYRANYQWMGADELTADLARLDGPFAAGEFLPRRLADRPLPPRAPLFQFEGCRLVSSSVDLRRLEDIPFETVDLQVVAGTGGCTIHFSQFSTALLLVQPSPGGRVVRTETETTDVILPAGAGALHVERRGLVRALAYTLGRPRAPAP